MARVLVQLDPEYVPWDVQEERPRMQRRRRRRRRGGSGKAVSPVLFVIPAVLLLVACVVGAVLVGPRRNAETRAETPSPAGSPPVVDVAEGGGGNLNPSAVECQGAPVIGVAGELLLYGVDVQPQTCQRYVILRGAEIVAFGNTDAATQCLTLDGDVYQAVGGVVDVRNLKKYTVQCDEETINP